MKGGGQYEWTDEPFGCSCHWEQGYCKGITPKTLPNDSVGHVDLFTEDAGTKETVTNNDI